MPRPKRSRRGAEHSCYFVLFQTGWCFWQKNFVARQLPVLKRSHAIAHPGHNWVMDRRLEIALVSGALAILCGYALLERLRRGRGRIQGNAISGKSQSSLFWAAMI